MAKCTSSFLHEHFENDSNDYFADGSETAVNTLTDVFVDHLSTICKLFKFTVENQPGNANNLENLFVSSTELLGFVFPKKKLLRVVLCR